MNNQEMIISVEDKYLQYMSDIVEKLNKVGLTNIQSMPKLGIITGSCPEHQIPAISQIEGVGQVERSREIYFASPNSPIQ